MKKGLFLTLVAALAMLATSVFAFAPVLQDIPDILVGELEDEAGWTVDRNFFRFTDAFVFDNYVTDDDTETSHLKWSFYNMPGSVGEFTINDLGEESSLNFLNPTNDIRAAAPTASFRDISASPVSQDPGPYSGTLSDVYMMMYVSDGINLDTTELRVTSVPDSLDGFSGGVSPAWKETFDAVGDWKLVRGVGFTAAPSGSGEWASGQISGVFPASEYYTWIESPDPTTTAPYMRIAYQASSIYVMKVKVSADADTTIAQMRMRVQSSDNVWSAMLLTGGGDDTTYGSVPTVAGKDFYLVWEPQASTADAFAALDVFSFNLNESTLYIDDVAVYRVDRPTGTVQKDFAGDFSAWVFGGGGTSWVTVNTNNITFTDIPLLAPGYASAAAFCKLTDNMAAGKVYRIAYALNRVGTADIDSVRLRVADTLAINYGSNIVMALSGDMTTSPKDYYLYHYAMNPTDTGLNSDLTLALDMITYGTTTTGSVVCTDVVVEEIQLPQLLD
jgi:hypothetical protein